MDSERELLEWAAKAVGRRLWIDTNGRFWGNSEPWNPLTDDGNALRLAVKLHLLVHVNAYMPAENAWGHVAVAWRGQREGFRPERFTDDPFAATRRAIVRAAAEIGRQATTGDTHD